MLKSCKRTKCHFHDKAYERTRAKTIFFGGRYILLREEQNFEKKKIKISMDYDFFFFFFTSLHFAIHSHSILFLYSFRPTLLPF